MVTGVASLGMSRMTARPQENTSFHQSENNIFKTFKSSLLSK